MGHSNSIATIERFWRSIKQKYARGLLLYRPIPGIERNLRRYLDRFTAKGRTEGSADALRTKSTWAKKTTASGSPGAA